MIVTCRDFPPSDLQLDHGRLRLPNTAPGALLDATGLSLHLHIDSLRRLLAPAPGCKAPLSWCSWPSGSPVEFKLGISFKKHTKGPK